MNKENINIINTPMGEILIHRILHSNHCQHCKKIFDKEQVIYADKPFMIMLHLQCAPFFDYNVAYPHEQPFIMYQNLSLNNLQL